jgi:Concanavalin A-like lectin/glucanases superfamily
MAKINCGFSQSWLQASMTLCFFTLITSIDMQLRTRLLLLLLSLAVNAAFGQSPGSGHCIGFNGTNQHLSGPMLAAYQFDQTLSLEAWVYPTAFSDNTIFGLNSQSFLGGPTGYSLRLQGSGANADLAFVAPNGSASTTGAPVRTFAWQHVALVSSATGVRLYLNGIEVVSAAAPAPFPGTSLPMRIAASPFQNGSAFFAGELDELRIWNTALTQQEIRDWMCKKVTPSHTAYASLTGYWRLDDASGGTASDLSPSANPLTLQNAPMWGWSAAPIGDRSIWQYGGAYDLSLASPAGDTFRVNNVNGSPTGLQLYAVDDAPNFVPTTAGYAAFDTSHYYGVLPIGGNAATMTMRYASGGNAFFAPLPACELGLAARGSSNFPFWNNSNGTLDLPGRAVLLSNFPAPIELLAGHRNNPWGIIALPDDSACIGDSIQVAATSGAPGYAWFLNGNPLPAPSSPGLWATQPGTYTLQVTVGACPYTSNPLPLAFLPPPTVTLSVPGTACIDAGVVPLSGSPAGGTFSGPGVSGGSLDPLLAGLGSQTVGYAYTNAAGCVGNANATLLIHPAPTALLSALPDLCQNAGPLTLSGGLPPGGTYSGPGVSGGQLDPFAAGLGAIPIAYTIVDANGCDDTAFTTLNILAPPTTPTISIAGGTLLSSATTGNQWYDSNGPIAGATGTTFAPGAAGIYFVIATGPNGCPSNPSLPVNFVVGLQAAATFGITAMPVPTAGSVQVAWPPSTEESHLELYQLDGRRLHVHTVPPGIGQHTLDLRAYPAGIFLVRISHTQGSGLVRVQRLP